MADHDSTLELPRRAVLRASGATAGLATVGTAQADDGDDGDSHTDCPDLLFSGRTTSCPGSTKDGCSDDHPETEAIQEQVREALESQYPTVGALIEDGFLPYFDVVTSERSGYSHWLNPEYLGDGANLDSERPESVMVDNESWRPTGVMFIATDGGEGIAEPPAVYGGDGDDEDRCSPWHTHTETPARFGWWFYRTIYEGDVSTSLPCPTPCMMHVWGYGDEGIYGHGAPPSVDFEDSGAASPGFQTDADPETEPLNPDALPDDLLERADMGEHTGGTGTDRGSLVSTVVDTVDRLFG